MHRVNRPCHRQSIRQDVEGRSLAPTCIMHACDVTHCCPGHPNLLSPSVAAPPSVSLLAAPGPHTALQWPIRRTEPWRKPHVLTAQSPASLLARVVCLNFCSPGYERHSRSAPERIAVGKWAERSRAGSTPLERTSSWTKDCSPVSSASPTHHTAKSEGRPELTATALQISPQTVVSSPLHFQGKVRGPKPVGTADLNHHSCLYGGTVGHWKIGAKRCWSRCVNCFNCCALCCVVWRCPGRGPDPFDRLAPRALAPLGPPVMPS